METTIAPTGNDVADNPGAESTNSPTPTGVYDLIIVGYGPSGVTAANLAAMQGLRIAIVEKDTDVFPRQRAISCDDEVMRVFQSIGLVGPIRATMHEGVTSKFVTSKGKEILSLASSITHNGYHQRNFFHQPHLEGELRKGILRYPELVDLFLGHEAVAVENSQDTATVIIKSTIDGTDVALEGKYVFACDGGSSTIRKSLGIKMEGTSLPDPWFDVQGETLQPMQGTPYFKFICDPKRPGVDCPCPGGMHRFEWRINKGDDVKEMSAKVWSVINDLARKGSGNPSLQVNEENLDVKRTWQYTFHVRRATQWRMGRVFLLGDAAHIMPAFAGAGMASAIRDTFNLVWKVKAVIDGRASESLLDTYEEEREPHAAAITKYAEKLGKIVQVKNPVLASLRNSYYRTIRHIPGLKSYTNSMKGKPVPGFQSGFVARPNRQKTPVGRTFPNYDVGTENGRMLIDDYLGQDLCILGLNADPRTLLSPSEVSAWEAWGARFIRIRTGTLVVGHDEVGDPVGRLWEWFQKNNNAQLAIVRPDRIVYGVDSDNVDLSPKFTEVKTRTMT